MKSNSHNWIIAVGLLVLSPFFALAQEEEEDEPEVYELSPFVIEEGEIQGYLATTTLAGTRLKTRLADVGAAISVYTEELLRDLGATDSETLLPYALNTESAGVFGNFSNGVAQDGNRINPHYAQRIRGLNPATLTRNYFTTNIPFDGYNTHSVTINRGPNSLLFGIGSAGGVIENSIRNATVGGDRGSVSLRLGERGSHRGTFDVNKVLVEDRLAVRVAGLYDEQEHKQRPAFERDKRMFVSLEAVLRKGEDSWFGRTTMRASHEQGQINSNRPNIVPPVYEFEQWFDDEHSLSRAGPEWYLEHNTLSNRGPHLFGGGQFFWLGASPNLGYPKALFNSNRPHEFIHHRAPYDVVEDDEIIQGWLSDGTFRDHPDVPAPMPINQQLNFNSIGTPVTLNFFAQIALISPDHTVPSFGDWDASRGFQGQQGASFDFKPRGPARKGWPAVYTSTQHALRGAGFKRPTMPLVMFDNNNLLITGDMNRVGQEFDATDFSLEQILFDGKGGFEFAYHEESYDTEADLSFSPGNFGVFGNSRNVRVDLNIWQRDGAALNPHVGRAFMNDFTRDRQFNQIGRESWRANAFYEIDLTESDGITKHFGRHILSGIKLNEERTVHSQAKRFHWGDDVTGGGAEARAFGGQPLGGGARQIRHSVYFGPSLLGDQFRTATDFRITDPINAPRINEGDVFKLQFINPGFGWGGYGSGEFPARDILTRSTGNRIEVSSEVLAYQGFFFEEMEHIPTLALVYGTRSDESRQFLSRNSDPGFSSNLPDGTADPEGGELLAVSTDPISGDTETTSIVARIPDSWNPLSDAVSLSVHWSESENFQPTRLRRNIFNEELNPPTGDTEERGFTLSMLEDRLSVRLNWYETNESQSTSGGATGLFQQFFNNAGRTPIINLINDRNQDLPFVQDSENTLEQGPYTYFVNGIIERGGTDPGLIITNDGAAPNGDPPHVNSTNVDDNASYDNFINAIINLLPARTRDALNWRVENDQFQQTFIPGLSAVESRAAEGFEVDIVGNITSNWSVMLNVGQQETINSDVAPALAAASAEVVANMQAAQFWQANHLLSVRNALLWDSEYIRLFSGPLAGIRAKQGQVSTEQREWRANLVTNYRFREGRLRGFNLGGAYRWQSKVSIGYDYDYSEEVDLYLPNLDGPIWGPEEENIDLWVGYNRKIELFGNLLNWRIQLNIRNAFKGEALIPIGADPNGVLRQFRSPSPTTYYLTNTLSW